MPGKRPGSSIMAERIPTPPRSPSPTLNPAVERGKQPVNQNHRQEGEQGMSAVVVAQTRPSPGTEKRPVDFEGVGNACLEGLQGMLTALDEFSQLKDAIVGCDIPRPLHLRLLAVAGNINRGVTSLYHPLFELVRLVQLYAADWEAKGSVLTALHQNYDEHHAHLKLALTKLQANQGEVVQSRKERLVLLWEALYARAMSREKQGRRWKYLIESFRQQAEKGLLLRYESDDDDDDSDDDERAETRLPLKPSSKKGKVPELLGAAERRDVERRRIRNEIETLKGEVSELKLTNEKLRDKLDRALIRKPVSNKGCMANLIDGSHAIHTGQQELSSAGDTEQNELLKSVGDAVRVVEDRIASYEQSGSHDGLNADMWANESSNAVTHILVKDVNGMGAIGIPDLSIEVRVSENGTDSDVAGRRLFVERNALGGLRVGEVLQVRGVSPASTVEFALVMGVDKKATIAIGSLKGDLVINAFHLHQQKDAIDGTTHISTTLATTMEIEMLKTGALEEFCAASEVEVPASLSLSLLASPFPFTEGHIDQLLTPLAEHAHVPITRRKGVRHELSSAMEHPDHALTSAQEAQKGESTAEDLYELLDVNSDDLKQATFTMEEMMDLTLLHTKQLQALQLQYEAQLKEVEERLTPKKVPKSQKTIQTDPMPPVEKIVEVEKLVEVEKIVEKVVEKIVEKIVKEEVRVEVPVEVPVYVKSKNSIHHPHFFNRNFTSPFLDRLAVYAKRSLQRQAELRQRVEAERDYIYRAQMASKFILDDGTNAHLSFGATIGDDDNGNALSVTSGTRGALAHTHASESLSSLSVGEPRPFSAPQDDPCLPAMFMPSAPNGTMSSRHSSAWYPMNSPSRKHHQPPSMVSLPPIKLPPLRGLGSAHGQGAHNHAAHRSSTASMAQDDGVPLASNASSRATSSTAVRAATSSPVAKAIRHTHDHGSRQQSRSPSLASSHFNMSDTVYEKEPTVYAMRRAKMARLRQTTHALRPEPVDRISDSERGLTGSASRHRTSDAGSANNTRSERSGDLKSNDHTGALDASDSGPVDSNRNGDATSPHHADMASSMTN